MSERKKLSDILPNSDRDRIASIWATTKAADDLKPLPTGEYRCRVASGELFNAKSGTAGYKLALEVFEGEHAGRRVWLDIWLTEAALGMAKRDLGKLGITSPEQLERPLPEGIIVAAKVALRKNDDGTEYNRVSRFDVVAVESAEPEPFAPTNGKPATPGPPPGPSSNADLIIERIADQQGGRVVAVDGGRIIKHDHRDSDGFNWGSGEQEDPPTPSRGRGAYSKP